MNVKEFWQLIEKTHTESGALPERQFDLLVQALVEMSERDIMNYHRIFETLMNRVYTTDVWNAAYIIRSYGDDSFSDFRGWLIAQGKTVFENVLCDPDNLADFVPVEARDQCYWESLSYTAHRAYEQKTATRGRCSRFWFSPCFDRSSAFIKS